MTKQRNWPAHFNHASLYPTSIGCSVKHMRICAMTNRASHFDKHPIVILHCLFTKYLPPCVWLIVAIDFIVLFQIFSIKIVLCHKKYLANILYHRVRFSGIFRDSGGRGLDKSLDILLEQNQELISRQAAQPGVRWYFIYLNIDNK